MLLASSTLHPRYAHALFLPLLVSLTTTAGTLTVGAGSTLSGSGVISGDVIVNSGGQVDPGTIEVGCLTVSSLQLTPGSSLAATVNGLAPCSQHDSVIVTGNVSAMQSSLAVSSGGGYTPALGDEVILVRVGASNGGIAPFLKGGVPRETVAVGGVAMSIEPAGGDGNDLSLFYRFRPSDPLILSARVADEGEIAIDFEIENNGGSPIETTIAQCSGGGETITANTGTGFVTVSGLNAVVSYTCTVSATNLAGTSASLASLPLTPSTVFPGIPIWLLIQATQ